MDTHCEKQNAKGELLIFKYTKCHSNQHITDQKYSRSTILISDERGIFHNLKFKMVSVKNPYGRNLGFLDRSRYFFLQVALQLYSRG
jgi:hypothetical protein